MGDKQSKEGRGDPNGVDANGDPNTDGNPPVSPLKQQYFTSWKTTMKLSKAKKVVGTWVDEHGHVHLHSARMHDYVEDTPRTDVEVENQQPALMLGDAARSARSGAVIMTNSGRPVSPTQYTGVMDGMVEGRHTAKKPKKAQSDSRNGSARNSSARNSNDKNPNPTAVGQEQDPPTGVAQDPTTGSSSDFVQPQPSHSARIHDYASDTPSERGVGSGRGVGKGMSSYKGGSTKGSTKGKPQESQTSHMLMIADGIASNSRSARGSNDKGSARGSNPPSSRIPPSQGVSSARSVRIHDYVSDNTPREDISGGGKGKGIAVSTPMASKGSGTGTQGNYSTEAPSINVIPPQQETPMFGNSHGSRLLMLTDASRQASQAGSPRSGSQAQSRTTSKAASVTNLPIIGDIASGSWISAFVGVSGGAGSGVGSRVGSRTASKASKYSQPSSRKESSRRGEAYSLSPTNTQPHTVGQTRPNLGLRRSSLHTVPGQVSGKAGTGANTGNYSSSLSPAYGRDHALKGRGQHSARMHPDSARNAEKNRLRQARADFGMTGSSLTQNPTRNQNPGRQRMVVGQLAPPDVPAGQVPVHPQASGDSWASEDFTGWPAVNHLDRAAKAENIEDMSTYRSEEGMLVGKDMSDLLGGRRYVS